MDVRKESLVSLVGSMKLAADRGITFINGVSGEHFVSYESLFHKAQLVLGALQKAGIREGDEALLQLDDNYDLLLAFWGCLLGKIIPLPVTTGHLGEHKQKVINIWRQLKNPVLITHRVIAGELEAYCNEDDGQYPTRQIADRWLDIQELKLHQDAGTVAAVSAGDIAYIQYSSGSTGTPKGIILTHRNLVTNILDIAERSETTENDTILSWMPLTHDMGMIGVHLLGICFHLSQYLIPTALFIRRPSIWLQKASEYRISQLYSPNFGYHYFLSASQKEGLRDLDLSNVRLIYNGAEPIYKDVCDDFLRTLSPYGLRPNVFFPAYGLAEASVAVSLPKPSTPLSFFYLDRNHLGVGQQVVHTADDRKSIALAGVGYAIENCAVRICSDGDQLLEASTVGHIQIKGANVTSGYYHAPDATAAALTADGWLRTGDLGCIIDGMLVVTGRSKNLIIINGVNYYPDDIIRNLLRIDGLELGKVAACQVDTERGGKLAVFIVYKGASLGFLTIVQQVRRVIMDRMGLEVMEVVPVSKIPKTTSGKVRNYQLVSDLLNGNYERQLSAIHHLEEQALLEAGDLSVEHLLKEIILEITGSSNIDADENLLKLGINSIMAMQIVARIQKVTNRAISVKDFFEAPSVRMLADFISRAERQQQVGIPSAGAQVTSAITFSQRRFWLMHQFETLQPALNLSYVAIIKGKISVDALNQSLLTVIGRHDSLRSCFADTDGAPYTRTVPAEELSFAAIAAPFSNGGTFEELLSRAGEEIRRPFDLTSAPLIRARLWSYDTDASLFVLTMHHIIVDGTSAEIFFSEVRQVYDALVSGQMVELPPVKVQHGNYVASVLAWESDQETTSHKYWKELLAEASPLISLPVVHQGNLSRQRNGKRLHYILQGELLNTIVLLSRNGEATIFMCLLTCLEILIYKYTNTTKLLIGTDANARTSEGMKDAVGHFINPIIIKNLLSPHEGFSALLSCIKEKMLTALSYQVCPFFNDPAGLPGFPPLQVIALYTERNRSWGLDGRLGDDVLVEKVDIDPQTTLADLSFEFNKEPDRLTVEVTYDTDLFEEKQILRLFGHLENIILTAGRDPGKPLLKYELPAKVEKHTLLDWSNNACSSVPEGTSVIPLFEEQVRRYTDHIAVVEGERSLTYGELNERINRFAHYLLLDGKLKKGNRIGIAMERSIDLIVAIFGVLKAGGTYVPIDCGFPPGRVAYIMENACEKVVATALFAGRNWIGTDVLLDIDRINLRLPEFSSADPAPCRKGENFAYLMYTSATTGHPKGVLVGDEALLNYVLTFREYFALSDKDAVICQSSIAFDVSIEEIFPVLCSGGKLVMAVNGGSDIEGLLEIMSRDNVTILTTTPSVIGEINKKEKLPDSLRTIISGGDVLPETYINNIAGHVSLYNTYGPTEATVCCCYHKIEPSTNTKVIGRPVKHAKVYILDEGTCLQPEYVTGEIFIGGGGLSGGYFKAPELTEQHFIDSPFEPGEKLYRTGDLGRWLPDGNIEFSGRKDFQVKINGYRIELQEIEQQMCRLEGVEEVAVVVRHRAGYGKQIVAYFTSGTTINIEFLRKALAYSLPVYMIPHQLIHVPQFPFLPNGKVDRNSLPDPDWDLATQTYSAPSNHSEAILAAIWQQVFKKPQIGIRDNFFELGGHSLIGAQIVSRIYKEIGLKLSLRVLFDNPTVEEMARYLKSADSSETVLMTQIATEDNYPLSAAQMRIWLLSQQREASLAYNVPCACRITGSLNKENVKDAFMQIVRRHESLRTRFVEIGGEPRQVIQRPEDIAWEIDYVDLRADTDQRDRLDNICKEEVAGIFDLQKGPLFRCKLLQTEEDEHVLIVVFHHIIVDAWSIELLLQEIFSYCRYPGRWMEDCGFQYKDYVVWHKAWAASAEATSQRSFWKDYLKKAADATCFPVYRVIGKQSFSGGVKEFVIAGEIVGKLREICVNHRLTLNHVFLFLHALLVHKISGCGRYIIGTLAAGRNTFEFERTVGIMINFLPVVCDLDTRKELIVEAKRFSSLLADIYDNQEYPLELITDEVLGRSVGELYNTMLTFRSYPVSSFSGGAEKADTAALSFHPFRIGSQTATLDCRFEIIDGGIDRDLSANLEYNECMSDETASLLIRKFVALVQLFSEQCHSRIDNVEFLTIAEASSLKQSLFRTSKPDKKNLIELHIAASFTADPLLRFISWWAKKTGMSLKCRLSGYNQVFRELVDNRRHTGDGSVMVVLQRMEDWARDLTAEDEAIITHLGNCCSELIDMIREKRKSMPCMVGLFPPPETGRNSGQMIEYYATLSDRMKKELSPLENVFLIDFSTLSLRYKIEQAYDAVGDRLGHIPFTEAYYAAMAGDIVRKAAALQGTMMKVIAVDADNTLWGGVCAEVGPQGVELTEDYQAVQRFLLHRFNEGFMLVLVSKNNEDDVWEVLEKNEQMILKKQHFINYRINWKPKSDNLREIAEELNVGLDSICFIDDNSLECHEVITALPQVFTLQMPARQTCFRDFLSHIWALDKIGTTTEDRQRNTMMVQERERRLLRENTGSLDDFIRRLGLQLYVYQLSGENAERAAQLMQRTNQFNNGGTRYTLEEIRQLMSQEAGLLWGISVKDRLGNYGMVGVVVATGISEVLHIETFVLSCRVLGRNVENGVLEALRLYCRENNYKSVMISVRDTGKNTPFLSFLTENKLVSGVVSQLSDRYLFDVERANATAFSGECYFEEVREEPLVSLTGKEVNEELPAVGAVVPEVNYIENLQLEDSMQPLHLYAPVKFNSAGLIVQDIDAFRASGSHDGTTEGRMRLLWQDVLGTADVDNNTDFYEAGGNSVKAIRLLSRIYREFKAEITYAAFIQNSNIAGLRSLIEDAAAAAQKQAIPLVPAAELYEASEAQYRIWISGFRAEKGAYNLYAAYALAGDFNDLAFRYALGELFERHEILRTVFVIENDRLFQQVRIDWQPEQTFSYLSLMDSPDPEDEARQMIQGECYRPIDIENGPLIKFRIFKTGYDRYILFFLCHHIIADGISMEIMMKEITASYTDYLINKRTKQVPLPVQYKDYAAWDRKRMTEKGYQIARQYWMNRFSGVHPDNKHAFSFPNNSSGSGSPVREWSSYLIEGVDYQSIIELAKRAGATVYTVLLSIVKVLCFRLTGEKDTVTGTVFSDRRDIRLTDQIGPYVTTVLLKTVIENTDSFRDVLERCREAINDAITHSGYTYYDLVADMGWKNKRNFTPFLDVVVLYQDVGFTRQEIPSLKVTKYEIPALNSRFDLSFVFEEEQYGIRLQIDYNRTLYTPQQIYFLYQTFGNLLGSVSNDPQLLIRYCLEDMLATEEGSSKDNYSCDFSF